jgi:8-oxo-dGTP pyrophosphatase MutT (NUDIX family)
MAQPKEGRTKDGAPMHFSVGALIEQDGKYLLIERAVPPLGFAGIAGHVDEGEDERQAVVREVKEEVGFEVRDPKLLFEEELDWNWCSKGVTSHYWHLFHCPVSGDLARSMRETKSAGWYSKEEIKNLTLEPVWEYWFKKLDII